MNAEKFLSEYFKKRKGILSHDVDACVKKIVSKQKIRSICEGPERKKHRGCIYGTDT